jgi:hypothetical protein
MVTVKLRRDFEQLMLFLCICTMKHQFPLRMLCVNGNHLLEFLSTGYKFKKRKAISGTANNLKVMLN